MTVKRLIRLTAPYKWLILLSVMLGFATIGSSLGLMATAGYLISAASLEGATIAAVWFAIIGVRFFGITRPAWRYAWQYVSHIVTFRLLARLRKHFYIAIEPLAPAILQTVHSGDVHQRLVSDVGELENFYQRVMAPPLIAVGVGLLSVWCLSRYGSPAIGLIMLAGFCTVGLLIPQGVARLGQQTARTRAARQGALNGITIEMIQGIGDLLLLPGRTEIETSAKQLTVEIEDASARLHLISSVGNGLSDLTTYGTLLAIILAAAPQIQAGRSDGLFLALLLLATLATFEAVQPLPEAWQHLNRGIAAGERLFALTDQEPAVQEPAVQEPLPTRFDIRFENLTFGYTPQRPIIDQLSLQLPAGETIIISGPSGVGKSTLFNLLLRFWEYQGIIEIGGRSLKRMKSDAVRTLFGVISPETKLFNTTIAANLRLAAPEASDGDLRQAIEAAQLTRFIEQLPDQLMTQIGEDGVQLSGGQRQRIGLARALLKEAPILLLDEPTLFLDQPTAEELVDDLIPLLTGKTALIISHRPDLWRRKMGQVSALVLQ